MKLPKYSSVFIAASGPDLAALAVTGLDDPSQKAVVAFLANALRATTGHTLYLRLCITYFMTGATEDRLQWSSDGSTFMDVERPGKVILASFAADADTKIVVLASARVVRETVDPNNPTTSNEAISVAAYDVAVDGKRIADRGLAAQNIEIKGGKFVLDTDPLVTHHDVDVNIVAQHSSTFFVFDPLVIIVPKRP